MQSCTIVYQWQNYTLFVHTLRMYRFNFLLHCLTKANSMRPNRISILRLSFITATLLDTLNQRAVQSGETQCTWSWEQKFFCSRSGHKNDPYTSELIKKKYIQTLSHNNMHDVRALVVGPNAHLEGVWGGQWWVGGCVFSLLCVLGW